MENTKQKSVEVKTKAQSGVRTITAIVTSSREDRDGDIVDVKSLRFPLKSGGYVLGKDLDGTQILDLPFLLNHSFNVEDMIGGWRKGQYIAATDEIQLEAGVSTREKAQDLMKLFDEDFVGNNFSITMSDYTYDEPYIYDAEVIECSFVFKGSNKEARLQMVKSILKGESMEKSTLEDKRAELAKLQAEIEAEEAKTVEDVEVEQKPAETEEEKTTTDTSEAEKANVAQSVEPENPVEAPAEKAETVEDTETKSNKEKEAETMEKSIAPKQVKEPLEVKDEVVTKSYSNKEIRENFVDQFQAKFVDPDKKKFAEVRSKAFEMAGIKSKEVLGAGTNAASLFLPTLVAQDIIKCYNTYAGYAAGVSKMDITGQTLIDLPVKGASQLFSRVGKGQKKPLNDTPVSTVRIEPREWATIFAWFDYVQKNSKLAVYNMIVDAMAESYALTEDHIVLKYAGGTVAGEATADNASGLVPLLTTATRTVTAADNTGAGIIAALAKALGAIKGQGDIEVGTNRATWMRVVTATNGMGNFIANADGTVTLGGAGTVSPVFSDALADGELVVGIRRNYEYVTNGGLATLFSQEAYLNDALGEGTDLNLFQQDASGLRGEFWADGTARCLNSFYLVKLAAQA